MRERKWLTLLVAALLVFASGCLYVVDKEVIDEDGDINDGDDNGEVNDGDDNGDVNDGDDNGDVNDDDDNGDVNDDDVVITLSAYASNWEGNEPAANVLDGNPNTVWHTQWWGVPDYPHSITIKISELVSVSQFRYLPRQNEENGIVTKFEIQYSVDGENFETIVDSEWVWDLDDPNGRDWKEVNFDPIEAIEIRLHITDALGNDPHASAAEIELVYDRL